MKGKTMGDDVPNEIKKLIVDQELAGVKQQIYRMSVSIEARKIAGYTEAENAQLVTEIERLVKMRDALSSKLAELK
jgi:predicted component of type VI protein secretion system